MSKTRARNLRTRHACCVATYYEPGDPEQTVVRMTAVVVDLATDKPVDRLAFDIDEYGFVTNGEGIEGEGIEVEDGLDACAALAASYGADLSVLSRPVPLARCRCGSGGSGCGGYLERCIRSSDLVASQAAVGRPS